MAGYQVETACYSSTQQAVEAIAAKMTGQVVQVGTDPYRVEATYSAPSSILYQGSQLNGTGTFTRTLSIDPPPCNLPGFEEGLDLGWLVAGVWIAVAAIVILRKGATS